MISQSIWDQVAQSKIAAAPGATNTAAWGQAPVQDIFSKINAGQYDPQYSGTNEVFSANGYQAIPWMGGYAVYKALDPTIAGDGANQLNGTPFDIYDPSGKYLGTNKFDSISSMSAEKNFGIGAAMLAGPFAAAIGGAGAAAGAAGAGAAEGGAAVGAGSLTGGGFVGEGALSGIGAWDAAMAGAAPWTAAGGAATAGGVLSGAGGGGVPPNPFLGGGGAATGGGGLSSMFGGGSSGGFDWSSLIGPALTAAGGAYAANQAGKASDAQIQAAREAMALMEPWRQAGMKGLNRLQELLGIGGNASAPDYGSAAKDFTIADFYANKDPAYQFRQDEGMKAIERAKSASGLLGSGGYFKDAMRFNQDLASTEYGKAYDRYGTNIARKLNPLQSLAGAGQSSANTIGEYTTQAGNAAAAGRVGRANALTGAIGQGYSMYANNQQQAQNNALMNRLLGGGF